MTDERTSKRVGKLAAMVLAFDDYYLDVWINDDPQRARKALRTLAASALTQAADKKLRPGIVYWEQRLDGSSVVKRGRHGVARKGQGKRSRS